MGTIAQFYDAILFKRVHLEIGHQVFLGRRIGDFHVFIAEQVTGRAAGAPHAHFVNIGIHVVVVVSEIQIAEGRQARIVLAGYRCLLHSINIKRHNMLVNRDSHVCPLAG